MQKLNQKSLLIFIVILIALCLFLIFHWNKEKNRSDYLNSITEQIIFRNFTNLISEFYYIADTLSYYNDEFTKQEKDLFTDSLNKSVITINGISHNLSFIIPQTTNLDSKYMDGSLLWRIEEVLGKVYEEKFSDEDKIHSIGNVIRDQNNQLYKMLYGEEPIGVEGINTKEEIMKAIGIINLMNEEIDEIVNK